MKIKFKLLFANVFWVCWAMILTGCNSGDASAKTISSEPTRLAKSADEPNAQADKKNNKPVITKKQFAALINLRDDIDFFQKKSKVDWKSVDSETATFAVELWLTSREISFATARLNAKANATLNMAGVFDTLHNRRVTNASRRRLVRDFLTIVHTDQQRSLDLAATFEARAESIVSAIGGKAAPALATYREFIVIQNLNKKETVASLASAVRDKTNPHRLASYFTIREYFPNEKLESPLSFAELEEISKQSRNPFQRKALAELVSRGQGRKIIEQYFVQRKKPTFDSRFAKFARERVEKAKEKIRNYKPSSKTWYSERNKASNQMDLGVWYCDLFKYHNHHNEIENAKENFVAAVNAYKQGLQYLKFEPASEDARRNIAHQKCILEFSLGYLYWLNKQYEKSIPYYKKAVESNPEDFDSAKELAIAYFDAGQFENAAVQFEKARQVLDDNYNYKLARRISGYSKRHDSESAFLLVKLIESQRKIGNHQEAQKNSKYLTRLLSGW